jgi:hypothetical protein
MVQTLFADGKRLEEDRELAKLIANLDGAREELHAIPISQLIGFFDSLAAHWKTSKELPKEVGANLEHLAQFIKKDNLERMLNTGLRGNFKVLDTFIEFGGDNRFFHAQPRGIAVHWLAGNVPILGFYSIIQAMLTKNVSLIKASSKGYNDLLRLVESMVAHSDDTLAGTTLAKFFSVVLVDKDDRKNQELMSEKADIRIAWGGPEAIESIMGLKRAFYCEDIIYGPKYSYAAISKDSLDDADRIANRLAFDVSTFDQYACSSPHTVFIESSIESAKEFAKQLADALEKVNRLMLPKQGTDPGKAMDILSLRTEYMITGNVYSSENTDWTVIYSEETGLAEACFSRVIFVRPIENLEDLAPFSDRRKQTLGLAVKDVERRKELVNALTFRGIDRCPPIGTLTLFESPWDGMFGVDKMVRWVTTWK